MLKHSMKKLFSLGLFVALSINILIASELNNSNFVTIGADKDAHDCIGSAGFTWCAKMKFCERPWELAEKKKFENTKVAFDNFCENKK